MIESVLHRYHYLDPVCLANGIAVSRNHADSIPARYAQFYDAYVAGPAGKVYDDEVLQIVPNGAYMGIWQVMTLNYVCQRRIHSTYPNKGNVNVRANLHRPAVPRTSETHLRPR